MIRRAFPATRLLLLTLAVALSIVGMVGYQLGQSRHAIWEGTNTINQNLLAAVSQLLEQHLKRIEQSLAHTDRQLEQHADTQGQGPAHDSLFQVPGAQPDDQIFVLDRSGAVRYAWNDYDAAQAQHIPSRDFFRVYQQPNPPALFISKPYFLDGADKPCLAVSRAW